VKPIIIRDEWKPTGKGNPVAKNLRRNKPQVIPDKRRKPPKHKEKEHE
jgi:hypothetical protein